MKIIFFKALVLVVLCSIALSFLPTCLAQDYNITYQLTNKPGGTVTYDLYVSIPESLVQYYSGLNNQLHSANDFAKFVTPYALKPIADKLWQIYSDQEDYVNGVLMIVHQITYEENSAETYPVQTMVNDVGKCDLFSDIAASILIAGGFSVVLLYYASQEHMEIGVHLNSTPTEIRYTNCYYVTYNDTRYYIGECTGGDWQEGWRIGECPSEFISASSQVITLENTLQALPWQVSASYNTLQSSTLSLGTTFNVLIEDSDFTLSGQINPTLESQNVTLYEQFDDSNWAQIGTTSTQSNGDYTYTYNPDSFGVYTFLASWSGNDVYAGATSSVIYVIVVPWYLIAIAILFIVGGISALIIYVAKRRRRQQTNQSITNTNNVPPPPPPDVPPPNG